jgi:hypothetical protein
MILVGDLKVVLTACAEVSTQRSIVISTPLHEVLVQISVEQPGKNPSDETFWLDEKD